jgi:hypothetical protein
MKYYIYQEDASAPSGSVHIAVIVASTGVSALHQAAAMYGVPVEELSVELAPHQDYSQHVSVPRTVYLD